ncbi:MAG: dihydrolipoamide acetyltransferase family protein [Pseudomonadales bacterium]
MSDIYPIAVPKWGIEMVEGTVNIWNKAVGDNISKGDEVFEMESDKIVNVWESPVDGVFRRQIAAEGDTVKVGRLLGIIAAADVDDAAIDEFIESYSGADAEPEPVVATEEPAKVTPAVQAPVAPSGDGSRRINPVVRRLAEELNVDLDNVVGTGRNGRVTKEDVQRTAKEGSPGVETSASGSGDVEVIPLSPTRKTIGKRLAKAKQEIPHYYLSTEYELDGLLAYRKKLNLDSGPRVSVNDLLVWCVARALKVVPEVNVNLVGDDIHQFKHANVAVAIATDNGLYPTTINQADTLTPRDISSITTELAGKAKTGSLTKDDISGASFTLSNLGMFGVSTFSAIVNPPMCAILALGRGEQRVVVKDGAPAVATMVNATLSCDHRVIDGALGARFLDALREEIQAAGNIEA